MLGVDITYGSSKPSRSCNVYRSAFFPHNKPNTKIYLNIKDLKDIYLSRKRGMQDDLPHKTVDELNRDVILTEPASLERFLQSFDYYMPVLA